MNESYGRDLDLNLLRVFVVVANAGSVTQAAATLYLTQPAVSAALGRLTRAVGAPLFVRRGRGLALTQRGERLRARAQPLLTAIVDAALAPARFDPRTSTRSLRIGMSDAMEGWLLPPLLRALDEHAPNMRIISVPVQFRTVPSALSTGAIDLAVTVADELPASVRREAVISTGYVCMFDPRHVRIPRSRRLTEREYFEREHVIVSYNGDLRGIVEDYLHKQRRVRCAVSSFSHMGAVLEGSALLSTVPSIVAQFILRLHPGLRITELPIALPGGAIELLWPVSSDDDDAAVYVRQTVREVCRALVERSRARTHGRRSRAGRPKANLR